MDLYLVDDRYLRFEFDAEQSTTLTVVLPESAFEPSSEESYVK